MPDNFFQSVGAGMMITAHTPPLEAKLLLRDGCVLYYFRISRMQLLQRLPLRENGHITICLDDVLSPK